MSIFSSVLKFVETIPDKITGKKSPSSVQPQKTASVQQQINAVNTESYGAKKSTSTVATTTVPLNIFGKQIYIPELFSTTSIGTGTDGYGKTTVSVADEIKTFVVLWDWKNGSIIKGAATWLAYGYNKITNKQGAAAQTITTVPDAQVNSLMLWIYAALAFLGICILSLLFKRRKK